MIPGNGSHATTAVCAAFLPTARARTVPGIRLWNQRFLTHESPIKALKWSICTSGTRNDQNLVSITQTWKKRPYPRGGFLSIVCRVEKSLARRGFSEGGWTHVRSDAVAKGIRRRKHGKGPTPCKVLVLSWSWSGREDLSLRSHTERRAGWLVSRSSHRAFATRLARSEDSPVPRRHSTSSSLPPDPVVDPEFWIRFIGRDDPNQLPGWMGAMNVHGSFLRLSIHRRDNSGHTCFLGSPR